MYFGFCIDYSVYHSDFVASGFSSGFCVSGLYPSTRMVDTERSLTVLYQTSVVLGSTSQVKKVYTIKLGVVYILSGVILSEPILSRGYVFEGTFSLTSAMVPRRIELRQVWNVHQQRALSRQLQMVKLHRKTCKDCKAATANVCQKIAVGRVRLALIQEPWTNGSKIMAFSLH